MCSVRKGVRRNFAKFRGNHLCQSLFINEENLAKVFSCEFFEISKNNFPSEHLWTTVCVTLKSAHKKILNYSNFLTNLNKVYDISCGSHILTYMFFQKQPPRGVFWKRCSESMQQKYRRTSKPKCDFNKVALQLY